MLKRTDLFVNGRVPHTPVKQYRSPSAILRETEWVGKSICQLSKEELKTLMKIDKKQHSLRYVVAVLKECSYRVATLNKQRSGKNKPLSVLGYLK